ncbi:MAG: tetratricopeptide repeat protein [Deltaproteobacteria bacterium]|nr:tetratricopeptide repeat protein [Deltaproteobacteria bacterium]
MNHQLPRNHRKFLLAPLLAFSFLAFLNGCATTGAGATSRTADGPERVDMDPVVVSSQKDALTGLDAYDANQLLTLSQEAYSSGDYDRTLKLSARLVEMFPESPAVPQALFNAGMAYEQLAEYALALEQFERVRKVPGVEPERVRETEFRMCPVLAKLGRWSEVADMFWSLRQSAALGPLEEIEARVGQGVAMFMLGDATTAEYEFRGALKFYEERSREEFLPAEYWVGQARFYLGEIFARAFEAKPLTAPTTNESEDKWAEQMGEELEAKCDLLLRAQNNFIRAIRVGHVGWATAAGYRIGSLYERLYDDLVQVPVPPGLDDEAKAVYLSELKSRVGVLVVKAIKVYELSLEAAERVGENNEWVTRTHASLERMKALYLDALRADG